MSVRTTTMDDTTGFHHHGFDASRPAIHVNFARSSGYGSSITVDDVRIPKLRTVSIISAAGDATIVRAEILDYGSAHVVSVVDRPSLHALRRVDVFVGPDRHKLRGVVNVERRLFLDDVSTVIVDLVGRLTIGSVDEPLDKSVLEMTALRRRLLMTPGEELFEGR